MNKSLEKHLKAAFERVSLLGAWRSIYLAEQVRLLGNQLAVCICSFSKNPIFFASIRSPARVLREKLTRTKQLSGCGLIFTGKHLCWRLFLIKLQAFRKVAGLQTFNKVQVCNFIKRRFQHRYFPVNIANFFFLKNHLFLQNTTSGCFWQLSKDKTLCANSNLYSFRYISIPT